MKNNIRRAVFLLLAAAILLSFSGCGKTGKQDLWEKAMFTQDQVIGTGETKIIIEVRTEDRSVELTVHTDKELLGDALLEHKLIEGEDGDYGLYVKAVNGIPADYEKDRRYWALYKGGEYLMTGVDGTGISDGDHYEFVYSK